MNSSHFRKLFETLTETLISTIVSVIIEKIDRYHIQISDTEKTIIIQNPTLEKKKETIKVKMLSSDSIVFEDNTSLNWDKIENFYDLLLILEYVEDWLKVKADESIQIVWSIYDFEDRAAEIEENTNANNLLFDRAKFPIALKILEDYHDYNLGICWDDVDDHLNQYCRIS